MKITDKLSLIVAAQNSPAGVIRVQRSNGAALFYHPECALASPLVLAFVAGHTFQHGRSGAIVKSAELQKYNDMLHAYKACARCRGYIRCGSIEAPVSTLDDVS